MKLSFCGEFKKCLPGPGTIILGWVHLFCFKVIVWGQRSWFISRTTLTNMDETMSSIDEKLSHFHKSFTVDRADTPLLSHSKKRRSRISSYESNSDRKRRNLSGVIASTWHIYIRFTFYTPSNLRHDFVQNFCEWSTVLFCHSYTTNQSSLEVV